MLRDARLQQSQIRIIPAIQRQIGDGLLADDAAQRAVRRIHLLSFAGDLHRLLRGSYLQSEIDHRFLANLQVQPSLRFGLKPAVLDFNVVVSDRQRGHSIRSARIRHTIARLICFGGLNRHSSARAVPRPMSP